MLVLHACALNLQPSAAVVIASAPLPNRHPSVPPLPNRQPSVPVRVRSVVASEMKDLAAGTIFTLLEREDGWNDVRMAVNASKRDRAKAWGELVDWVDRASDYVRPASSWVSVIGEEVLEYTGAAEKASELRDAVTGVTNSMKEGGLQGAIVSTLSSVAAKREAKIQAIAYAKAEEEARAAAAAAAKRKRELPLVGAANIALLVGIPAATIGLLAYLATAPTP